MDGIQIETDQALTALANKDLKAFHEKLIHTGYPVLGIRAPLLRTLAKQIAHKYGETFLDTYVPKTHEGMLLYGLVLAQSRIDIARLLERVDTFLPKIDNWAVCDMVSTSMKQFARHKEVVWKHFFPLKDSSREFERRWLSVIAMTYYLDPLHIHDVLSLYREIPNGMYYVDMAVAWGIATALSKFYCAAKVLLEEKSLPKFVQNKAIQKARESYRITPEQKSYLYTLRIEKAADK